MVDRAHKPSALSPSTTGPQPRVNSDGKKVTASLPSGDSVEVMLYGATVISWKNNGKENMWLSSNANLEGKKAIRGGVPVVFPNFGPAPKNHTTSSLPQHGFARISSWEYLGTTSSESGDQGKGSDDSIRLDFGLTPNNLSDDMKKAWPYDFSLQYSVTLSKDGLQTMLNVRNEGDKPFDFQTLFHTYFAVPDISKVKVTGLSGIRYIDKILNATEHDSKGNELRFEGTVDRVYKSFTQDTTSILVDDKPRLDVIRDNMQDTVIWNPWKEGAEAIADFEPKDGYKNMVCVEAGAVNGWITLEAQDGFEAGQILKSYL
ncbi:galactose mutarotase-like protein [Aureobasidium pullulans]|nr:galactose mutarotase-like protein [Aureobasidium pullulans]